MRLLQRCQNLLRGARAAAEQGSAYSPSGVQHWQSAVQQLGRSCVADGRADAALGATLLQQLRSMRHEASSSLLSASSGLSAGVRQSTSPALPWALAQAQTRGLFGAVKAKAPNPQIHTHDKYKKTNPQPTYDFLLGRFLLDRNGAVWHRQANYRHHRYNKTASRLTRLKRWKPLAAAYAAKLKKLGFRERYWAPPLAGEVPGAADGGAGKRAMAPFRAPKRRSAVPDLDPTWGNPALRQSWRPPNRQRPERGVYLR